MSSTVCKNPSACRNPLRSGPCVSTRCRDALAPVHRYVVISPRYGRGAQPRPVVEVLATAKEQGRSQALFGDLWDLYDHLLSEMHRWELQAWERYGNEVDSELFDAVIGALWGVRISLAERLFGENKRIAPDDDLLALVTLDLAHG